MRKQAYRKTTYTHFSHRYLPHAIAAVLLGIALTGCGPSPAPSSPSQSGSPGGTATAQSDPGSTISPSETAAAKEPSPPAKGSRDNSIRCKKPSADGALSISGDVATIDHSHTDNGYICVKYTGAVPIIKLRITGPDEEVYTYDLKTNDYEVFPLTGGNGDYTVAVYENIEGTQYAVAMSEIINVEVADELDAYLYPNQYVNFDENSKAVKKASELVYSANSDLEAVELIYDYIVGNITYDKAKAESKPTNYVPDIDDTLESGKGICLDYAALMCSMLRSQNIPTRLEIGYAADAYHAWISVHIDDLGWVNGIIEFSGDTWELMDPTFGASTNDDTLKKFIGDGNNYTLQKMY